MVIIHPLKFKLYRLDDIMDHLNKLYFTLLKNYNPNLNSSDPEFLILCYAHLDDGRCKQRIQCSSKQEAEALSSHIEYLYNKEKYELAVEKNQKIKTNADRVITQTIKECVGIVYDGLDDKVFETAFELSKKQLDEKKFGKYLIYDMDKLYESTLLNYKLLTAYPFDTI